MALPLFLPCAAGVEPLLEEEIQRILPSKILYPTRGGVGLDGGPIEVMKLNLHSRLAMRVLAEVAEGPYQNENDLYRLARSVDWLQWITPQHTLRVDTTATHSPLKSLNFAALRIKDGVCDVMREATGERPSVDIRHPDLPLHLHVGTERASLYVDTSGESLFKRGWREDKGDAPLKETLAAAMLAAAGWRGTPEAGGALHDPTCGSGTIAIEAAQIACGIAPGLKRRFAFERLLPFTDDDSRAEWQRQKSHAQARIHPSAVPIYASDVSFRMVDFARRNAERAGVADAIQFNGGDALERPAPDLPEGLPGTLMINPPYGERIEVAGKAARPSAEDRDTPDDFFPRLSAHWKRAYTKHPAGWTAWVLSPDMKLAGSMRLKESRRVPMWNGPIECRLYRFDLVAGSNRAPTGQDTASRGPSQK
ncbi:THUMP domain-containing class I SAM-dependent RNA methyltransferase [Piscinibacter gummiphilus]|uniref:RNA methyltransferase n=1 Tax=Piscinibacter gummiphilus TaxID=946333 RepID=A0A1W6L3F4_9BURK|nr:THUMP domain-containing protein [Piscinibacter gummiphilus]ARN18814.1 RNA methyltransferase [Piscinibacter gummiphilus]ATU63458.1 RNA methyltransferase [Piscinibacter gummiphilus]